MSAVSAEDSPLLALLFRAVQGVSLMHWLLLALAIALEVAGTTAMKYSNGLSNLIPSLLMSLFYVLSIVALAFALKKIELSIAYAIWAGMGTAIIAMLGIFYFQESVSAMKVISILLIVVGVVGLNLAGLHDGGGTTP